MSGLRLGTLVHYQSKDHHMTVYICPAKNEKSDLEEQSKLGAMFPPDSCCCHAYNGPKARKKELSSQVRAAKTHVPDKSGSYLKTHTKCSANVTQPQLLPRLGQGFCPD